MASDTRVLFLEQELERLRDERDEMLHDMVRLENYCEQLHDTNCMKDIRIESLVKTLLLHGIDVEKLSFSSPLVTDLSDSVQNLDLS